MTNIVEKSNWLTDGEKSVINRQFFPQGAKDEDKIYCMKVAESFNLNPILKQIYFVPRRTKVGNDWVTKVEPLAGRDSFLTLAHRTNKFAGIESKVEIKETPIFSNGKWVRENDLVATATVYRKDSERPFVVSVNYREYVQKTNNGDVTKFWKDKPETMLKKVAESQCLRKAFDITGIYAEEENDIVYDVTPIKEEKKDINQLQQKQVSPFDTLLKEMLDNGIDEEKSREFLNSNSDKLEAYINDKDTFFNDCMNLVL